MTSEVSVVIGSYNRLSYLKLTLESLREELEGVDHEILVVDGGSTDGTVAWLTRQSDVVTILQHNRGEWRGKRIERKSWGYFMNLGFMAAHGRFVCMLSDDCLVVPGAIRGGMELLDSRLKAGEKVAAAAFYWRNWPEQERYRVGYTFGDRLFVNHGLYTKEALQAVGYADEDSYRFYHADGDLCLRMWEEGYHCIDSPDSYIEHHSHANLSVRSSNAAVQKRDWQTYTKRWKRLGAPKRDWLEKEFDDPAQTASRWQRTEGLRRWLPI